MPSNDMPGSNTVKRDDIVAYSTLFIDALEIKFKLFQALPLELSLNILRYLNPNERKQFAAASLSSYALAYHNYVWRRPYEVKSEQFMRYGYIWQRLLKIHLSKDFSVEPDEFKISLEFEREELCKPQNEQELWLIRKRTYFAEQLQLDITKKQQALQKQAKALHETLVSKYTLADLITAQADYVNNKDEFYLDIAQQANGKHYEQALYFLRQAAELDTVFTDNTAITTALILPDILPIHAQQSLQESSALSDNIYALLLRDSSQNLSPTAIMILVSLSEDATVRLLKADQGKDTIATKARNLLNKLTSADWLLMLKYHLGARTETDLATIVEAFTTQNPAFMRDWTEQELVELAQVRRLPESDLINPFNQAKKNPFAIHILRNPRLREKLTEDSYYMQVAAKISPYEIDWLDSDYKASLMNYFITVLNDNELRECFFYRTHHYDSIWSSFFLRREEIIANLNRDGLIDCLSRISGISGIGFQQLATREFLRERLIQFGPEAIVQLFRQAHLWGYVDVFLDDERILAMLTDTHIAEIFKILRLKCDKANSFLKEKPRNFKKRLNLPLLNLIIAGDGCPISAANYEYYSAYLQERDGITEVITADSSAVTSNVLYEDKQTDKSLLHSLYAFLANITQLLLANIKYILSKNLFKV